MKYTVITTFNADGYAKYGQRMIQTFLKTWPKEVTLIVYAEDCVVTETASNLVIKNINIVDALTVFKKAWQHVPKANGNVMDDPVRSKRKDAGKGFKWDAVRFAHKVYSIFHCAKNTPTDWLIWMDADTVCHSPITLKDIEKLCPATIDLCFLGRRDKYTECGLYAMNLLSLRTRDFLTQFQKYYDNAEQGIFTLAEWHDSFVFDAVRKHLPLQEFDWSGHLITGEGHPLINSKWGAWLDHLKGDRKTLGKSKSKDLKVIRQESYWTNLDRR
jgi:hypothetical protein